MAAPAEPPAYSVSYGGFCVNSPSFANTMLPCKMEASNSLPPSPSSSRSSLSLEPLSPPTSGRLPEALSYTHLLSATPYTDIPHLLDRPSSCTSLSHLSRHPCPFTLRKRPADTSAPVEGVHMALKRICESTVKDGSIPYRSREAGSGSASRPADDAHGNELLDSSMWQSGCVLENVASKDLDDMLDLLLQEAEVAPTLSAQSKSVGCLESSLLAYKSDHCKDESKELYTKLSNNHLACSVRSMRMWSDILQDSGSSSCPQKWIEGSAASNSAGTQELRLEPVKVNARTCSEELMKQIASTSGSSKQEESDSKGEKLQEDQYKPRISWQGASGRWAGPTLLDIESALASTSPAPPTHPFGKPPAFTPSSFLYSIRDILQQEPLPPHSLSSFVYKEESSLEEDEKLATWRRLQKRNHMEPRYTVKIRCEEDAVNDGYRWRKYGQKSIKNSPYPRSYYRCSSGKCNVKKQVERSGEDAGLLLVSYEGIHLHHRPTSLLSPSLPHVSSFPSHV